MKLHLWVYIFTLIFVYSVSLFGRFQSIALLLVSSITLFVVYTYSVVEAFTRWSPKNLFLSILAGILTVYIYMYDEDVNITLACIVLVSELVGMGIGYAIYRIAQRIKERNLS